MSRRLAIGATGAAVLLLALAAAGCGGSKSSSSDASVQWANGVCGAATAWKNELTKLVRSTRANGLTEESLTTTASSVQAVTQTFASTLKSLGAPKTKAGTQAKQDIDTLANQLTQGADAIKQALDASSVPVALTTIATTVASMQTNIRSAVTNLQSLDANGELKQAFDSADNCAPLTQS